jgi:Protein of unknown function (DUF664)
MIQNDLRHYLQQSRDALLRALDGVSDYDARRPVMPTGTNLLGLVKHVAGVEAGYLGECVGRPPSPPVPWNEDGSAWESGDMWAKPDESRDHIIGIYRAVWGNSDASIAELPLDAPAFVEWWPAERQHPTFGHLLARVLAETAQHAGHADIVRETIDGRGGRDHDDVGDTRWWTDYVASIQSAADTFR